MSFRWWSALKTWPGGGGGVLGIMILLDAVDVWYQVLDIWVERVAGLFLICILAYLHSSEALDKVFPAEDDQVVHTWYIISSTFVKKWTRLRQTDGGGSLSYRLYKGRLHIITPPRLWDLLVNNVFVARSDVVPTGWRRVNFPFLHHSSLEWCACVWRGFATSTTSPQVSPVQSIGNIYVYIYISLFYFPFFFVVVRKFV